MDGSGITVAVIDSGVDTRHVDVDNGKVVAFQDFVAAPDPSCSAPPSPPRPFDQLGHGTHVSSTIAGTGEANSRYRGVAPGASLVSLRVFDCKGSSSFSVVNAALDWAITNRSLYGIDVLNLSLGGFATGLDGTDSTSQLVNQAAAAGIVPVVAAGNNGPSGSTVNTPGVASYAVTVGAMRAGDRGRALASFSSHGPTGDGRIKPDVLAPGVDIYAAWPNLSYSGNFPGSSYNLQSGTSMATPFVAGVAALMLQADPALAPSGTSCAVGSVGCSHGVVDATMLTPLTEVLHASADDWGTPGPDPVNGWGALRAYAAVAAAAGQPDSAGPAYPSHAARAGTLASTDSTDVWAFSPVDPAEPVTVTIAIPVQNGFTGPFVTVQIRDADGAVVPTFFDCYSVSTSWSYCSDISGGGTGLQKGGWFEPTTAGPYYAVVRSEMGTTSARRRAWRLPAPSWSPCHGSAMSRPLSVPVIDHLPVGSDGITRRVNLQPDGSQSRSGASSSWYMSNRSPAVSSDGRFVAFRTQAPDLVPSKAYTFPEVFVRDAVEGTTELVSLNSGGVVTDGTKEFRDMSEDGTRVLFTASGTNFVPGDTTAGFDLFLRDRVTGTTELVDLTTDGQQMPNCPGWCQLSGRISGDRQAVVFTTPVSMTPGDTDGLPDVYVRDLATATTTWVSRSTEGGNGSPGGYLYGAMSPSISRDGGVVVFIDDVGGLAAGDAPGVFNLFVHNRLQETTVLANIGEDGTRRPLAIWDGYALSPDGRYLAFKTLDGGTHLRDLVAGTTTPLSVASGPIWSIGSLSEGSRLLTVGTPSGVVIHDMITGTDTPSTGGALSPNGRYSTFETSSGSVVSGDTNEPTTHSSG